MEFELLTTERLQLRKISPEVFQFVFENHNEAEIKAFFGIISDLQFSREYAMYHKGMVTFNKTFLNFQLIDAAIGKPIGWCGFHTWYTEHARAEMGYGMLDEQYKNKGLMTEAIRAVIEYGFVKMNLHRIEALIAPDNIPSLKLIKKMNFTQEGHLREHYNKNNRMEDSLVFSLLKREWMF